MLTGWYPRFEKGRGITNVEKADHLALGVSEGVIPGDSTSLISLNSTYADFVDRTFSMKGFAPTLVAGVLSVFLSLPLYVRSQVFFLLILRWPSFLQRFFC